MDKRYKTDMLVMELLAHQDDLSTNLRQLPKQLHQAIKAERQLKDAANACLHTATHDRQTIASKVPFAVPEEWQPRSRNSRGPQLSLGRHNPSHSTVIATSGALTVPGRSVVSAVVTCCLRTSTAYTHPAFSAITVTMGSAHECIRDRSLTAMGAEGHSDHQA
ncbi:hypothetical protein BAUCODRAFT_464548 [Baudoinia panamericana UAMH 10762]|uniref:Uncharacterized protein n=1 Tax=Baudoinia panamericana (strain UAMH 10762) TaxID=717646 RepID=M2NAH9_BAUPA|nr:uncharacterized protein BAUCODRAFT_464548 [Baudoinia panamericana UAMH 10762]EMC96139.1 hypothetical protein BAUCODRAFT_464548 [Baudoinia panamericana UAMH 10762]